MASCPNYTGIIYLTLLKSLVFLLTTSAQRMSSVVEEGPADQSQFERNKILIRGLSEKTCADGLVNFIEVRCAGKEVKDVQMLKNGKALVTMADEIKGTYLSIEFGELAGISLSYFVDPFASYRR